MARVKGGPAMAITATNVLRGRNAWISGPFFALQAARDTGCAELNWR
jgi:hypothetical protein